LMSNTVAPPTSLLSIEIHKPPRLQDEGALVVPPAFAVNHGLLYALTGEPGSLTKESLRERLTPRGVDGEDFAT
jgi:hypothetical protein